MIHNHKYCCIAFVSMAAGLLQGATVIGEWSGTADSDGSVISGGFEIDLNEEGDFYIDDQPVTSLLIDEFEIKETNFKEYAVARVWYTLDGVRTESASPAILQIRDEVEDHVGFTHGDFYRIFNGDDYTFSLNDPGNHLESPLLDSHELPRSIDDFDFEGFDFAEFSRMPTLMTWHNSWRRTSRRAGQASSQIFQA